ncbi:small multi-drug export protein [Candidatus Pacearchaeota archaeon]|jgi:uncharacterized membrane protein|nr:small multi-drug export protein [Candidatus Pacearchaeota archaeon]
MDWNIIFYMILSALPIVELRGGLPLAINYAIENNLSISCIFFLIVLTNILVIFFIFYFFDNLHKIFLRYSWYKKFFNFYVSKMQKKIDKFENKYSALGFLALMIFVAIPLPGTGAWTGCFVSWILGLDRKKSIFSIAAGVLMAGILMLLATLGFLMFF